MVFEDRGGAIPFPEVGDVFASRHLEQMIGSGSDGIVYQVWNDSLSRHEALKIIPVGKDSRERVVDNQRRFYDEIRAANQVYSPSLAKIFDAGQEPEFFWYVMEYIDAVNLREELGAVPPRVFRDYEIVGIILDLAKVLDQLSSGQPQIIHGDLKPSNIMICRNEGVYQRAVLIDFGAVTTITKDGESAGQGPTTVKGSVPYMAPEVASAGLLLPLSDQFSLACVAYELLAGGRAYPNGSFRTFGDDRPVRNQVSGRGRNVDRVLHRAWSVDPTDRWKTSTEFAESLAAAIHANSHSLLCGRMPRKVPIALVRMIPFGFIGLLLGRFMRANSRDSA